MANPEDPVPLVTDRLSMATVVREIYLGYVSQKDMVIPTKLLTEGFETLVKNAIRPLLRRAKKSNALNKSPLQLILCGNSFTWMEIMGYISDNDILPNDFSDGLISLYVQQVLNDLEINSIQMTLLQMWRQHLVTSETANRCFTGKNRTKDGEIMISVGDDLEIFQSKLTKFPQKLIGQKLTYFLPKARF